MFRFPLLVVTLGLALPLYAQPNEAPTRFTIDPADAVPAVPLRPTEPARQIEADLKGFVEEMNGRATLGSRFVIGARFGFYGADE